LVDVSVLEKAGEVLPAGNLISVDVEERSGGLADEVQETALVRSRPTPRNGMDRFGTVEEKNQDAAAAKE